jgi:hypothetical protein
LDLESLVDLVQYLLDLSLLLLQLILFHLGDQVLLVVLEDLVGLADLLPDLVDLADRLGLVGPVDLLDLVFLLCYYLFHYLFYHQI